MGESLEKASDLVSTEFVISVIIVIIALLVVLAKVLPVIIKWFKTARNAVNQYEELMKAVAQNTADIRLINDKIGRDYARLNQLQQLTIKQQGYIEDSLEERELIIRSLLGVVQGLQEVGANGPTKKAEAEIQAYLLRKSHETSAE